ncbi:nitroreductase family protein [Streptosporangium vulgare]|uniref:nitroreductase family protein n=1 Tax=Streptosporangium vulgare TaxID=46190 RepID=UPI003CD0B410
MDSRRAVRAFSDEPVPKEVLERVLTAATRAPSSGNLQPWHLYVVTGEPLAELKKHATARALAGDPGDEREYPMYPAELTSPYLDRFFRCCFPAVQSAGNRVRRPRQAHEDRRLELGGVRGAGRTVLLPRPDDGARAVGGTRGCTYRRSCCC